ncbi:uncharacterized protein LOC107883408 [Acyrthosiphon pisum]|uniref:Uncharacterized protein n=1 Tax=Acyrthosiphon pisum TaxID=7029 RepID=A0A8R2H4Z6_ACYPI|nr:uncharacterized protein LOC107883408 [Acyrthosiphon pisum]|eukprot:XP_016658851.1 PREDICTED: uncharacterized protein LOC107883408 [Acyrthosiphon pisum]
MHRKFKTGDVDTCIQSPKSVHNEGNVVVSEVIELLIGSTYYKAQINHIETIANDPSMNEDLSKRKYVSFKCSKPSRTCEICIAFRKKLCSAYHLVHPVNNEFVTKKKWMKCIKKKFKGDRHYGLYKEIAKYSSYDFEVELRNIFEYNYHFKAEDERHRDYKERIKKKSIMDSIIDTNYWFTLITKINKLI